jgi:hypothetical protein
MWRVVHAAVDHGSGATARLALLIMVRYGPRSALGVLALRVLTVILRRH